MPKRPLVVYTHRVPEAGPALLRAACDLITRDDDTSLAPQEIARIAQHADALCFFVPDLIDAPLIAQLEGVKILAGFGKGYDNVDVAAATARGIWVTNVPHALTDATADLTFGLILGLARKIAEGDAVVRGGAHPGWHPSRLLGTSLTGATLGILGFGQIGQALARRAVGFGMRVLYADPRRAPESIEAALNAPFTQRDALLAQSDIVVLALPLTATTRNTIDARAIGAMKPGALLVNPARGSLVDESIVADALADGRLGGYAADVFELEDQQFADRRTSVEPRLIALRDRTLFTPHLGTALTEARIQLARVQAMNVLHALSGQRPPDAVNSPGATN